MHRRITTVLGAAATAAALGLSGCGGDSAPPASAPMPSTPSTSAPAAGVAAPLPPASALTDVLYRLADTAVPGAEKVSLVEDASPDDAAALDGFGRALQDSGYTPLTFEATDLAWSPSDPGHVLADVTASTPNENAGRFSFPMEFNSNDGSWQLSRQTADILLAMGQVAAPAPPPTR